MIQEYRTGSSHSAPTLWTRDNVGEVIPDAVTPLTWSVLGPVTNRAAANVLRRMGGTAQRADLFGCYSGYVYLNNTLLQQTLGRYYPSQASWRGLPRLAITASRALGLIIVLPAEARQHLASVQSDSRPAWDLPPSQALSRLEALRDHMTEVMETHLAVSLLATLLAQALERIAGRDAASRLLAWAGHSAPATAADALWDVAQSLDDPAQRERVLAAPACQLQAQLMARGDDVFLGQQLQRCLDRYGYKASQEFELATPRWQDDATPMMAMFQAQVRVMAAGETAPFVTGSPSMRDRLVPGAATARRFAALRETLKDAIVRRLAEFRRGYMVLGQALVARDLLPDTTAVFFLTHAEIAGCVTGEDGRFGLCDLVAERRLEWERARDEHPAFALEQLDGVRAPLAYPAAPTAATTPLLHGIGASPGVFRGRAHIAHTPEEAAMLSPNEALIAPAVTPGWAPVLRVAGALVTEIGGMLSHGAIIAREYGVPSVMNVAAATRQIRTGDPILIDGSRGTVQVVEES